MTRFLYLARHAEADGSGDLTDTGHRQADQLGSHLSAVPLAAIHHSPLTRAARTARLVAAHLPGIPLHESDLIGDYPPSDPTPDELPPHFAPTVHTYMSQFSEPDRTAGPVLAQRALDQFAHPLDQDRHELIITHSQIVTWFVRHALQAPLWRWLTLNAANAALTVITYVPTRPPQLVRFNDQTHLSPTNPT